MAKPAVKKGRGKSGKSVKDYQRGDAVNGYDVAVDGDDRGEGHNSKFVANGDELRDFRDLVLEEWALIKQIMDAARLKCEGPRAAIKNAKKVLIESGYHAEELATLMRKFRLEDKLAHVADNLDDDQKPHFDSLVKALGDFGETPLGAAALSSAQH